MAKIVLQRPPQTDEELWWVIKAFFGVALPTAVHPDCRAKGHVSPFHAVAHAFFGRPPNYAVWYASRGSGKSLALAVLGLVKSFVWDVDVTILGGSMTQSRNVAEHMAKLMAYRNAPVFAMQAMTKTELRLHTQKTIRPLPASQTTVRGPHPPLQLLDEIDEMELAIYDASMGQAMPQDNHWDFTVPEYIVASSTWQNPEGVMTEVIDRARKNKQPIFTWCLAAGSEVTTRRGGRAIELVQPGDEVMTRQGWRPVTDAWCSGTRKTIRVVFDNGRSLVCTPDHLIATPEGFLPAGSLSAGSEVFGATSPTDAVPAVLADPDVTRVGHVVSAPAHFGALAVPPGAPDVLAGGDRLKVSDVAAKGHSAQVVDLLPGFDKADQVLPDSDVGVGTAPVRGLGDAVSTSGGVRPQDAVVGVSAELGPVDLVTLRHVVKVSPSAYQPVYDITVEDAHEFVANGIVVHNCWRELLRTPDNPWGWMSQRQVDVKRKTVSAMMWKTEYELNEPSGASRAFDLERLDQIFVPYPRPLQIIDKGDSYRSWTWEEPTPEGQYRIGADWAKEIDHTVITVIRADKRPHRVAKLIRVQKMPYPVMIGFYNREIQAYHAYGEHDRTGLGNVVDDYVKYPDQSEGFVMNGRPRTELLLEYVTAVEHGDYQLPTNEVLDEVDEAGNPAILEGLDRFKRSHRATTVADVYAPGKWDSHLPDDVSSMALMHRALVRSPVPITEETGVSRVPDVRKVDKPFHTKPGEDGFVVRSEGGVTVIDERYEDNGLIDMLVRSDGTPDTGLWTPDEF